MLSAAQHFTRLLELDSKNTLGHNEEAQFTVAAASLRSARGASQLESFIATYPQSPRQREALSTLIGFFSDEHDAENAKSYFLRYLEKWPADASMMNNYAWGCAERRVDLNYAAEMARKAIEIASSPDEKASYLDTYAAVMFAQGKVDEAITLEQQAIDILKNLPNARMAPYEESMEKFRAASKH
jgi:tetratricopeptide (TPR) repeat protein